MSKRIHGTLIAAVIAVATCSDSEPTAPVSTESPALHSTVSRAITEFTTFLTPSLTNAAECITVFEDGSRRRQNCEGTGIFTGDLEGIEVFDSFSGFRDAEGNGYSSAHFIFDVCHADLGCGIFDGWFWGRGVAGEPPTPLTVRAHGTSGDFVGLSMVATSIRHPGDPHFTVSGIIG